MSSQQMTAAEQSLLDDAWERINALGGYFAPDDLEGRGFSHAIDRALHEIEELGGMDPLVRKLATPH